MNVISIIVEYNPLHLGHVYQIREARRSIGADSAVMVVMSGCFTQRGEPALTDKWSRTCMALDAGVDLVLELPFIYACSSAERFASGGVLTLQASGLQSTLVFGSESGDLASLQQVAGRLTPETPAFQEALHKYLDQGLSFPAARQHAIAAQWPQDSLADLLSEPNNILAIEYLKALRTIPDCRLTPLTIQRRGQGYRETALQSAAEAPSASAVRQAVFARTRLAEQTDLAGLLLDLAGALPEKTLAELMARIQQGPGPLFLEDLAVPIITLLRGSTVHHLESIPGMGEGLGRRLATAAARPGKDEDGRLAALLADSRTRRFTRSRMQRALIALLADIKTDDYKLIDHCGGPRYLRVLGFNRRGRYLLKLMRRLAEQPVITRASDFLEYGNDSALQRMAELDQIATDLWHLAAGRSCGRDFDTPVIMR